MRTRLALVLLLLIVAPGVAHPNGRFPAPTDIHFKPGDHDVMGFGVTWGFLVTKDAGDTWKWVCEGAVGFSGVFDPDYEFTSTGLLLATTTSQDGLRLTRDFCTWDPAPPPLGSSDGIEPAKMVSQVEVGPDGAIYAMTPYDTGSPVYISTDDGVSFSRLSSPRGDTAWWESLEVAPTLLAGGNSRLYLTGYDLAPSTGAKTRYLLRSSNSGSSWTSLPITDFTFGGDMSDLQIATVSPTDPDLVFARVYQQNGTSVGDAIYRSINGGDSWTKVFEAGDDVPVVTVRGNGDVVVATRLSAATNPASGLHVSTDGGATFGTQMLEDPAYCLRERDDGTLFFCSDGVDPSYEALSKGTTLGSWTDVMSFKDVDDVIDCPAGTDAADSCDSLWCGITMQFGIAGFEEACTPVDAGLPADGGTLTPPDKSCTDCSGGDPGTMGLLVVLAGVPILRRRRKK